MDGQVLHGEGSGGMHPVDPQKCNSQFLSAYGVQAQQTKMRVKNATYNFDPCVVRCRYVRPVCSKINKNHRFQNLHFDTPIIVSYIFDPPPRGVI